MLTDSPTHDVPDDHGDSAPGAASRTFLVVVDDSEEMPIALHFACLRARNTGGRVALLHVMEPAEFQHWLGVGELMQQERRDAAEALMREYGQKAEEVSGVPPAVHIREGNRAEELFNLLGEDPSISIVVLAASAKGDGPGPIISFILGKGAGRLRTPFTIVPGTLSIEDVEHLA